MGVDVSFEMLSGGEAVDDRMGVKERLGVSRTDMEGEGVAGDLERECDGYVNELVSDTLPEGIGRVGDADVVGLDLDCVVEDVGRFVLVLVSLLESLSVPVGDSPLCDTDFDVDQVAESKEKDCADVTLELVLSLTSIDTDNAVLEGVTEVDAVGDSVPV